MGSYSEYRKKGQSHKEWLQEQFRENCEVLDVAAVGGVMYAAVRTEGYVSAEVWPFHWSRGEYNFWYKPQSESVGPYDSNAPARILDLLSPLPPEQADPAVEDNWAAQWRQRCRENIAAKQAFVKPKPGQFISLKDGWDSGMEYRVVEAPQSVGYWDKEGRRKSRKRPGIFAIGADGRQYRIPARAIASVR